MHKIIGCSAVALSLTLASVPVMSPAIAQSDNAAYVQHEGQCGGFVPSEDGGSGPFLIGELHQVSTSSGVTTLVCKFDIPEWALPATATRAEGFPCNTYAGVTTDSKMVASPGGQATLVCRVNEAKP